MGSVSIKEQRNVKHVAIGGLMSNAFACVALYPWFEWAPALIWMCEAAIRSVDRGAMVTGVSGTTGTKLAAATTCVNAVSRATIQRAFGTRNPRAVALNVAISKLLEVNGIPRRVLSRNPVDMGSIDVLHPMFGIGVYHHSNAV
jgi:hypothetical protein